MGGSTIEVTWQGPADDWQDDVISVVEPGAENLIATVVPNWCRGPAAAQPGADPRPRYRGQYEIVYGIEPGGRIIARQPIEVTRAQASLDAPASAKLGEDIPVVYSGDGFAGDRVVIVPADTPDSKMWGVGVNYGFIATAVKPPGTLRGAAVKVPGRYELRYVTGLQHLVLARDAMVIQP